MNDYNYFSFLKNKLSELIKESKKIYHGFQMTDVEINNLKNACNFLEEAIKEVKQKEIELEQKR